MIPWGAYVIGEDNGCALFCINKYSAPSLPPHSSPPALSTTREWVETWDTRYIRTGRHILCKYGGIRIPTPPQIDSKSGRRGALFLFIRITALRTRRNCKFGWIYYSRMRSQWEAHHLAVMRRKQIVTCLLQIKKTNSGWLHSKVEQHRLMRSWINLNNFLVSIHVIKQIVPLGIIFPKLNMLR